MKTINEIVNHVIYSDYGDLLNYISGLIDIKDLDISSVNFRNIVYSYFDKHYNLYYYLYIGNIDSAVLLLEYEYYRKFLRSNYSVRLTNRIIRIKNYKFIHKERNLYNLKDLDTGKEYINLNKSPLSEFKFF